MNGLPGRLVVLAAWMGLVFAATSTGAQVSDDGTEELGRYEPNSGFKIANTDMGDLNLRIFTYIRYLNQKGLDPTSTDSFGNTTSLDRRQDIQFQKVTINFQGWLMSQKLRYGLSLPTIVGGTGDIFYSSFQVNF